jgi:hypothetical protein
MHVRLRPLCAGRPCQEMASPATRPTSSFSPFLPRIHCFPNLFKVYVEVHGIGINF